MFTNYEVESLYNDVRERKLMIDYKLDMFELFNYNKTGQNKLLIKKLNLINKDRYIDVIPKLNKILSYTIFCYKIDQLMNNYRHI